MFGPVADLRDLFRATHPAARAQPDPPLLLTTTSGDFAVDLALGWSTGSSDAIRVRSFANYRETTDAGRHVDGIEEGLREVFGQGPMREVRDGLMAGLRAVLHVRLVGPRFAGPTKAELANPEAIWCVADVIAQQSPGKLEEHPELAASLAVRSLARADLGQRGPATR